MELPDFLARAKWPFIGSLIGALVLVAVASAAMVPILGRWPALSVFLLGILISVVAWLLARRMPRFGPGDVGVLVSIACAGSISAESVQIEGVLENLHQRLRIDAETVEGARVRIERVPSHIRINSDDEAQAVLERSDAVYLIWARCATGSRHGNHRLEFQKIRFVVKHRPLPREHQRQFEADLSLVDLLNAQFRIRLDNDLADVHEVASSLGLVSRYQIGLALAVSGYFDEALRILESTHPIASKSARLRERINSLCSALLIARWHSALPFPGTPSGKLRESLSDATRAIKLDSKNFPAWVLKSSCHLLLGEKFAARAAHAQAASVGKRADYAAIQLNEAVFCIMDGRFDRALAHYLDAHRNNPNLLEVQSASEWLEAAAEHIDHSFVFGAAVLNELELDSSRARELFVECLRFLPQGTSSYNYATKRSEIGERTFKSQKPSLARARKRTRRTTSRKTHS